MVTLPRVIIFGVSGSGKSTIGKLLAQKLNVPFLDADQFHSNENIEKMNSGIPLTDKDRLPWLFSINERLKNSQNDGWVLACSALKESYRTILNNDLKDIHWVLLNGDFDQIASRMAERKDHFMSPSLLKSQFETLEIPEYGIEVSIDYSPSQIVQQILDHIID